MTHRTSSTHRTSVRRAAAVALAGAALLLTAACGGSSAGTSSTGSGTGSNSGSGAAAGVHVASTSLGKSVVASNGRTLYLLTSDKNGKTTCTGGCLQIWPPVMVASGAPKATGVSGSLGTLGRGGTKQLTIAGHPVYLYAADGAAGDTSGQGIKSYGGTWWAVSPSGTAITSASGSGGGGAVGGY
jgi:predicted lipoprotein with Yx(FWY)xxD motif